MKAYLRNDHRPNLVHSAQSAPLHNTDSRGTLWTRIRAAVRTEPALHDWIFGAQQSTSSAVPKGGTIFSDLTVECVDLTCSGQAAPGNRLAALDFSYWRTKCQ